MADSAPIRRLAVFSPSSFYLSTFALLLLYSKPCRSPK
jgi:hypothetical protein